MPDTAAQSHRIVVGFDGSEGSQRALAWAADEARQRGAELLIVRAWTPGEFGTDEEQGQIAQKRLDDEVQAFFDQGTTPDFTTQAEAATRPRCSCVTRRTPTCWLWGPGAGADSLV